MIEPIGPDQAPKPTRLHRLSRSTPIRLGVFSLALLALLVTAAVTIGASPSPSPSGSGSSSFGGPGVFGGGPWVKSGLGSLFGGRGLQRLGIGQISITAINGTSVSLKTDDGWTRTITISGSTTITKGGQTIALSDLKVGDHVRFRETRSSDGSFTIDAVEVVVPSVAGEVTALSAAGFSVKGRDGLTWAITVTGSTTYTVGSAAKAGSKADVKVGERVLVAGTQGSGTNTLTALSVRIQLPAVIGRVTAKTAGTITISGRAGTTFTVHVSSGTAYEVRGVSNASLANITVGMVILAEGSQRADGSLDAVTVHGGPVAGQDLRGGPLAPKTGAPAILGVPWREG